MTCCGDANARQSRVATKDRNVAILKYSKDTQPAARDQQPPLRDEPRLVAPPSRGSRLRVGKVVCNPCRHSYHCDSKSSCASPRDTCRPTPRRSGSEGRHKVRRSEFTASIMISWAILHVKTSECCVCTPAPRQSRKSEEVDNRMQSTM